MQKVVKIGQRWKCETGEILIIRDLDFKDQVFRAGVIGLDGSELDGILEGPLQNLPLFLEDMRAQLMEETNG